MLARTLLAPACLTAACLGAPLHAEAPNLSADPQGQPGSVAQLVLAQQAYQTALRQGEVLALLSAIRLARGISQRPATGWTLETRGKALPDAPAGKPAAPQPGGETAMLIARNLAGEDPDLQDLVYALDAQLPGTHQDTALVASSDLAPGQTDVWTLPLFGEVLAEIGLIGDGDGPLTLTVADEGGTPLCTRPPGSQPRLCSLTPARNGFFTVAIANAGTTVNSYRLLAN